MTLDDEPKPLSESEFLNSELTPIVSVTGERSLVAPTNRAEVDSLNKIRSYDEVTRGRLLELETRLPDAEKIFEKSFGSPYPNDYDDRLLALIDKV
jgi:hypothetical protein